MKRLLTKKNKPIYHYKDGVRVDGAPESVSGDLLGITGDLTGVSGNLNNCEITNKERAKGIDIEDLIKD